MSNRSIEEEPVYPGVQLKNKEIDGFPYVEAEVRSLRSSGITRDHLRIIGAGAPELAAHPIVYSDTYSNAPEDVVYVYARHRIDQATFFSRLDSYLEKNLAEFPELTGKPLHLSLQVHGEFTEVDLELPLVRHLEIRPDRIDFARMSVLPGDMAIEFTGEPIVCSQEFLFTQKGVLSRKLESPLFGFDASRSEFWAAFLTDIHWASELVRKEILRAVIQSAAQVAA